MVKNYIFYDFLYTVRIASTRALQSLFHLGSESNGLVATGQFILDTNSVIRFFFVFGMLNVMKCKWP